MSHGATVEKPTLVRRLFLRALFLFVALIATDAVIVGWLFFHDFDQRAIRTKLAEAAGAASALADALVREVAPAGALDLVRLANRRDELEDLLRQHTPERTLVRFVEFLDSSGRLVVRRQIDDAGEWRTQYGGAFGGGAPDNPDTPPPPRTAGGRWRGYAAVGSAQRVVQRSLGAGVGTLLLGVDAGPLDEEVARLRRTLVVRLLAGGAISLVLLLVAFVFVLRLVQRTRRLENEAQRAEQLAYLGTLASGLAHEIRNPLNAMNINMQMLEEELAAQETAAPTLDLLRSARGEVLRLERLVKDFLAFARPQASRVEEIAPGALVADVIRFVRPLFAERGVGLELTQAPGAPVVRIDAGQIRQALLNILQNALEVSARGKTVAVTVGATAQGEARIEIQDQGPGIPSELQPLVFQVFWSRKPAGSGLGLPIAQRVVEAHGGRIEVESREGAGSTFRIVLPAALATTAGETSGATP